MNWMEDAERVMHTELGNDPTEDEMEQWYGDYYREHLYPFLPSSRIGKHDDRE